MVKYLLLALAACGYDRPPALAALDAAVAVIGAPTSLTYETPHVDYLRSAAIQPNHPTASGPIDTYQVQPSLPSGLTLDAATGVISGTPVADQPGLRYTVSASNAAGHIEATLYIAVDDRAPSHLDYNGSPMNLSVGVPMSPQAASWMDGTPTEFSVEPALPLGLVLDRYTGQISGTPTKVSAAADYAIRGSNVVGTATVAISIAVTGAPAGLSYDTQAGTYVVGTKIADNHPHLQAGSADTWTVAPQLPAGIAIDAATGIISGTPSAASAQTSYTVTAKRGTDQVTTTLGIRVDPNLSAPAGLAYAINPAIYGRGLAIATNSVSSTGGAIASYATTGLPAGLAFDTGTGAITGAPTARQAPTVYTVTGTNPIGSANVAISISVVDIAPGDLTFAHATATYTKGVAIAPNLPSYTGSPFTACTAAPSLPAGLALSTGCVVSGTPSAPTAGATYAITGSNDAGSTAASLTITVVDLAPTNLAYQSPSISYSRGVAIAPNLPTSSGGAVVSYAVSPTLPVGLSLSPTTGAITGTPSVATASQSYTVTAANSGGSAMAQVVIAITDTAAGSLAYTRPLATYTLGRSIPPNQPIITGGAIAHWSVAPPLPAGLALESNGTIDGVTSSIAAVQTYAITGTNAAGSVTAQIQLQVVAARTIGFDNALSTGGGAHACAIVDEGIECWGSNFQGQLGDGTTTDAAAPIWVKGMEGATTVRTGGAHTCAILDGALWCWGSNTNGQLGFVGASSSTPVKVSLPTPVAAVALGDNHTCAVVQGGVYCWGSNNHGQLADGTTTDRATPAAVTSIASGVRSIAAGGNHTCVQVYGGADCWGSNGNGELGDGTTTDRTQAMGVVGMMYGVQAITASAVDSCAIVNGGAWCWGMNAHGALGIGTTDVHTVPVAVSGLGAGVQAIAASFSGACAIRSGAVLCWGYNQFGQVGDGTTTDRFAPVATSITSGAQAIGAAGDAACAIVDGATSCWGMNTFGQLGIGNTVEKHVPTPVGGLGHGIGGLATSGNTSCIVVDGGIDCWGDGEDYLTGNGDFHNTSVPTRVSNIATGAQSVAVSHEHACAIVNGGAQCWGMNDEGQLGLTGFAFRTVPTAVPGLASGVQQIATGHYFTCALVNGGVQCWGTNTDGQLGNNSTAQSNAPVAVSGLGAGVQAIAVGWDHACALSAGIVYCWGANLDGALGNGTTTHSLVPIAVNGIGPGVRAISAGDQQTCAVHWNVTMCWGANQHGQVGDGTVVDRLVPTTVSGSSAASVVSGALSFCTCILSRGVTCWGQNDDGQLGLAATEVHAPTALPGFETGVQALSVGQHATCAIVAGGVACLGFNAFGELGNGTTTNSATPVLVSPL